MGEHKSLSHGGLGYCDAMDWQILRASRTPGPGHYYHDDLLESISGGKLAKAKAKSSIEWEEHRARQIPAPGDYYVDDLLDSLPGGRMAKDKAKSFIEWEQLRASRIPGPDYDTDTAWKNLEGKAGSRKNGTSLGGRVGPGVMPYPFQDTTAPGSCPVRREPSSSHELALCPWREDDWKQRKKEAGQALSRSAARPSYYEPPKTQQHDQRAPIAKPGENSYARSLTPWRDNPRATSRAKYGQATADEGGTATRAQRPKSAPPGKRRAAPSKTPEERRQEVAAQMPWRDKAKWAEADRAVQAMREKSERAKPSAAAALLAARGPFGGPQATIAAAARRAERGVGARPRPRTAGPRTAALLRESTNEVESGRTASRATRRAARKQPLLDSEAIDGGRRGSSHVELRAKYEPSRHASTAGLLRLASDPGAIGGSVGASFHLGGEAWRLNLAERAERLAAFSFGDGEPVETGVILVDAPAMQKPKGKKKKNGKSMQDFMPSTIALCGGTERMA